MAILLADTNGILWQIDALPNGVLQSTNVGPGSAPSIFLNDQNGTSSWQVGITTGGLLTTTSIAFNASYPRAVGLSSGYFLIVLPSGLLADTLGGPLSTVDNQEFSGGAVSAAKNQTRLFS